MKADPTTPFRILVFGDFGGYRKSLGKEPRAIPCPIRVDIDNIADLPRQMGTTLSVVGGIQTGTRTIEIETLDDFHPDAIIKKTPHLARLCELRNRLLKTKVTDEIVFELKQLLNAYGQDVLVPTPSTPSA